MTLVLDNVDHGLLSGVSLTLEAGLHVVVGAPADGTLELLQLCAGDLPPRRGRVVLDGKAPASHPELRKALACAFGDETFEEPTVGRAVARRLTLHACKTTPEEVFGRFESTHLLARQPQSLTWNEHRTVELLVALAVEGPALILLHEPLLATGSAPAMDSLLEVLVDKSRAAIVLCTTQSPRQAALLSPQALLLEDGQFKRATLIATRPAFAPGSPARVSVRSDDPARFARALTDHQAVSALSWTDDSTLVLEGSEVEALCSAVWAVANDERLVVQQLAQVFPEVSEIRATHAALARASYERTYGHVTAPAGGFRS